MKYFILAIAISLLSCCCSNKKIDGQIYIGEIRTAKKTISLELSLDTNQKKASISSSFGIRDMAVSLTKLDDDSLIFNVPAYAVSYSGKVQRNRETISGVWMQGGKSYTVIFEQQKVSKTDIPKPVNFEFEEKEVTIDVNPTLHLAGTLTLPNGVQKCPAVILLGVAGKTDRDQSFGPYRSFKHIAEYLTKSGFAVLRCDDRGVGGSTGSLYESSYDDLVGDARITINYLRKHQRIRSDKVGVLGISEGAALGGILAGTGQVNFAVLLSYPALPGPVTIRHQINSLSTTYEFSERQTNLLHSDFRKIQELILVNKNTEIRKKQIKNHLTASSAEVKDLTRYLFVPQDIDEAAELYSGAWYESQLAYAPAQFISSINCPTLFMYGNQDPFVNFKYHIPALEQELRTNTDAKPEIQLLEDVNHIFQDASNGSPLNYIENNNTFSSRALNKIEEWLRNVAQ